MKNSKKIYLVLFGMAAATAGSIFATTWSEPTATPPNGNTAAPINVSGSAQTKSGRLTIDGLTIGGEALSIGNNEMFTVGVGGNGVGANKYCNLGGTNCKTIEDLSTPNINLSDYLTIADANARFCYENPVGSGNWINCPASGNGDDKHVENGYITGTTLHLDMSDDTSVSISGLPSGGGGGNPSTLWQSGTFSNSGEYVIPTTSDEHIVGNLCYNTGNACLTVFSEIDDSNTFATSLKSTSAGEGSSSGGPAVRIMERDGVSAISLSAKLANINTQQQHEVYISENKYTLRQSEELIASYGKTNAGGHPYPGIMTYYKALNIKSNTASALIEGPIPDGSSAAFYKFSVNGNAIIDGGGLYIHKKSTGGGDLYVDGIVEVSGNGGVKAKQFVYISDKRLKKEISTTKGLDVITKLRGVDFTWKNSNKKDIGLIAQEVEEVLPNLVSTDKKSGLKSVQYGNLVAPLIEAVKEQQKQIEQLEAKVEELQKRN